MAGPSSWNVLPVDVGSSLFIWSMDRFANLLKMHLFGVAYSQVLSNVYYTL